MYPIVSKVRWAIAAIPLPTMASRPDRFEWSASFCIHHSPRRRIVFEALEPSNTLGPLSFGLRRSPDHDTPQHHHPSCVVFFVIVIVIVIVVRRRRRRTGRAVSGGGAWAGRQAEEVAWAALPAASVAVSGPRRRGFQGWWTPEEPRVNPRRSPLAMRECSHHQRRWEVEGGPRQWTSPRLTGRTAEW